MSTASIRGAACLLAASILNVAAAGPYDAPGAVQPAQGYGAPVQGGGSPAAVASMGQYPQLNAPLYPSPVQYTPSYNGGTIITNQALAPHEMLYPHTYHAMYPPFFYKVKGGWIWTPFGMRQHEQWKLQGTEVSVKYRSHYPLFSGFHPPAVH